MRILDPKNTCFYPTILSKTNILLDNDLDLRPILNIFNLSRFQNEVWFQNAEGFNKLTPETTAVLSGLYSSTSIQIINVVFAFNRLTLDFEWTPISK